MRKSLLQVALAIATIGGATMLLAGTCSGGSSTVNDTTDSGGQRATSASYTMDGSIGGIGGISSAPADSTKNGYIGQLTEVTNLFVIALPSSVNEGSSLQLSGLAGLDDATVLALAGSNIVWTTPGFPIASISPAGAATAAIVWSNTSGVVTGTYLGINGSGMMLVLDGNPDNFGTYAGDGIPDSWQVLHFGTNNPLGVASATNSTGMNNTYAYIADLNPTNPASVFEVVAVSNLPPNRMVYFTSSSNRVYALLWTTNLISGAWTNLSGATPVEGNGGILSLSDTNTTALRFYQIQAQVVP
jgi:hypothetical protein